MLNWGSLTPATRDSTDGSPGAPETRAADCRPALLQKQGTLQAKGHRIKLLLSYTTYSAVFSGLVILFLNFIIKLPNWPQISSNSVMLWPWAGSNEAVRNSPPTALYLSKGLWWAFRCKGGVGGGTRPAGGRSVCWKISLRIELTHHELQILGKDGSLFTPPQPSHFLKVRFLSALTASIPNPPPYIPLQICLTIVKSWSKESTSPSSPKSPFHQHAGRVNTAPSKSGYSAVRLKLPSPKFKKFPAVFVQLILSSTCI